MFPHNSSSHEISTETNAFVQNSMGDVVVLGKRSLSGVGEGRGSEHARYCDIEFIKSNIMAEPICHPEDTAANDFSTVLSSQSGKHSFASIAPACQSVAPQTTNHPLIYDNNNSNNNNNNCNANDNANTNNNNNNNNNRNNNNSKNNNNDNPNRPTDHRENLQGKIAIAESIMMDVTKSGKIVRNSRKLGSEVVKDEQSSSANKSKSTSKTLSDNKTSFSRLSIRVLSLSVDLRVRGKGVSGFRKKNNDRKHEEEEEEDEEDDEDDALEDGVQLAPSLVRKLKSEPAVCTPSARLLIRRSDNSLDNYYYSLVRSCFDTGDNNNVKDNSRIKDANYKSVILLSSSRNRDFLRVCRPDSVLEIRVVARLPLEYEKEFDDDDDANDKDYDDDQEEEEDDYDYNDGEDDDDDDDTWRRNTGSSSITLIVPGNDIVFKQLAHKSSPLGPRARELTQTVCVPLSLRVKDNRRIKYNDEAGSEDVDEDDKIDLSINSKRRKRRKMEKGRLDSCYKTSFFLTIKNTNYENHDDVESQLNDGISRTVATITVGALLFQDNVKSNEPLRAGCTKFHPVSIVKPLSKSMIRDLRCRLLLINKLVEVYIPNSTTCKPTMTLKRQSASRTIGVPGSRAVYLTRPDYFAISSGTLGDYRILPDMNKSKIIEDDHEELLCRSTDHSWRSSLINLARNLIHQVTSSTAYSWEQRKRLKSVLKTLFPEKKTEQENVIHTYKKNWGISEILKLAGGGESSLNSGGAANWGSTQASAPNNNNVNQSGWGGTPGNPSGNTGNSGSWAGNSVNRTVSGNPNQNQNQGPPGGQNVPGNVNKVSNPNQQSGQQPGPPTSQSNNPSQGGQNNNQWPQAKANNPGGPGPNPSVQNNNNNNVPQPQSASTGNNNQSSNSSQGSVTSGTTTTSNNPSTKQQLEQLNTMREALFSQDGWGCQYVNQDTKWDFPTSPEPSLSKDGVPMWKPAVNNGTDLWEANLRNGGQPPPQQQAKTPWGHTPATNIGGTWGEDDEGADTSNMWTGAPTPSQPNTGQWTGTTGNQAAVSNWGDPRIDHRDPRDLRSVDPREMRDPRDHRMSLDPRDHMRVIDPMARDPRMADMRGDPRGISGRLNGANADAMWGQPPGPPHHQMGHQHPSGPPTKMLNPSNINQWGAPPPKDIMPGKPTGWEEPSPPTQRRNVQNYDDGTSLWGNPVANQRAMPGSKVSHWKDPAPNLGRGGMQCPPGMPQNRMPGQPGMKPDVSGPMWGHPGGPGGRNGTWADGPHDTTSWDDPKTPAAWNEAQLNPGTWSGPTAHKPKPMGPAASWGDSDMDPTPSWSHPAKPTLTKEVIWNSREFRYLCDLGFKKEDVELALRNREMNREEALELLSQLRPLDQWRRHDAHSSYDPANQASTTPTYPRFNHVAQQMSFPPGSGVPSGTATGGVGGSVASASLLKLQQQQQQQQSAVPLQQQQPSSNAPQPPFNQTSRASQNQPSTQQLRLLVQQIQLAVQEGYLNHQILNQPLAPQTLILLNQLLQQIKILQQLHQQHSVQSTMKGNNQSVLQISVQITKTKQQIANLQNQIAVQQATYMKQQQQQQHPAPPSQSSEYYKTSVHDPMSALQNSFSDLTMNKEPPVSQQQSRLNQWKLPSLDKDGELVTNEFSRAPGTTTASKPGLHPSIPAGYTQSHGSPNVINPLLGQGDGTWSSRLGESGWPDPGNTDSTDGKDWQPGAAGAAGAAGVAFTDLVPEFEPGKPWKGTQMKSIEDDPSITPGSVVRSPLSLAAIKDPDAIFSSSSKTSPPPQPTNPDTSIPSLSNSTWTFNPPATTPGAFTSSKNTWGETAPPPTAVTSELWGAPMSKVRGPPPGLGSKNSGNTSNGWAGLGTVGRSSSSWGLQSSSNTGWVSTWLLLKNLTPQIDGSTLKTLCMQHGPVQDFRLYLNHGIALTKYSSRDEAIKAQGALNNCVLGNTTIFAESPADSEVHTLLQQLSHGGQQQGGGTTAAGWGLRPSNKTGPPPDTWGGSSSQLWGAPPSSNSLWSNTGIDTNDQQRATPSSLNSYLPGDLLGGESM